MKKFIAVCIVCILGMPSVTADPRWGTAPAPGRRMSFGAIQALARHRRPQETSQPNHPIEHAVDRRQPVYDVSPLSFEEDQAQLPAATSYIAPPVQQAPQYSQVRPHTPVHTDPPSYAQPARVPAPETSRGWFFAQPTKPTQEDLRAIGDDIVVYCYRVVRDVTPQAPQDLSFGNKQSERRQRIIGKWDTLPVEVQGPLSDLIAAAKAFATAQENNFPHPQEEPRVERPRFDHVSEMAPVTTRLMYQLLADIDAKSSFWAKRRKSLRNEAFFNEAWDNISWWNARHPLAELLRKIISADHAVRVYIGKNFSKPGFSAALRRFTSKVGG